MAPTRYSNEIPGIEVSAPRLWSNPIANWARSPGGGPFTQFAKGFIGNTPLNTQPREIASLMFAGFTPQGMDNLGGQIKDLHNLGAYAVSHPREVVQTAGEAIAGNPAYFGGAGLAMLVHPPKLDPNEPMLLHLADAGGWGGIGKNFTPSNVVKSIFTHGLQPTLPTFIRKRVQPLVNTFGSSNVERLAQRFGAIMRDPSLYSDAPGFGRGGLTPEGALEASRALEKITGSNDFLRILYGHFGDRPPAGIPQPEELSRYLTQFVRGLADAPGSSPHMSTHWDALRRVYTMADGEGWSNEKGFPSLALLSAPGGRRDFHLFGIRQNDLMPIEEPFSDRRLPWKFDWEYGHQVLSRTPGRPFYGGVPMIYHDVKPSALYAPIYEHPPIFDPTERRVGAPLKGWQRLDTVGDLEEFNRNNLLPYRSGQIKAHKAPVNKKPWQMKEQAAMEKGFGFTDLDEEELAKHEAFNADGPQPPDVEAYHPGITWPQMQEKVQQWGAGFEGPEQQQVYSYLDSPAAKHLNTTEKTALLHFMQNDPGTPFELPAGHGLPPEYATSLQAKVNQHLKDLHPYSQHLENVLAVNEPHPFAKIHESTLSLMAGEGSYNPGLEHMYKAVGDLNDPATFKKPFMGQPLKKKGLEPGMTWSDISQGIKDKTLHMTTSQHVAYQHLIFNDNLTPSDKTTVLHAVLYSPQTEFKAETLSHEAQLGVQAKLSALQEYDKGLVQVENAYIAAGGKNLYEGDAEDFHKMTIAKLKQMGAYKPKYASIYKAYGIACIKHLKSELDGL